MSSMGIPTNCLAEEFKVTRTREVLLYRVCSAGIVVRTREKWQAQEAVQQAEMRLRHGILVVSVAVGWAGLGSHTTPHYDRAWTKWVRALTRNIIWSELWKSEPARLKFLIQSIALFR